MPRIKALQPEYMNKDFPSYITGYMHRAHLTQEMISDKLGYTRQTFSYKLKHCAFGYKELIIIFDALQLSDDEILFLMVLDRKLNAGSRRTE